MRKPAWYVMQVTTGREQAACDAVMRACENKRDRAGNELVRECFAPAYRTQFKLHGVWYDEERTLLPGYVIVVTDDPWRFALVLRDVPGLARILRMGETFSPLHDDDRDWIERWTREGDRTIPMSVGYKEGDCIVVTEGPLQGQEAMIVRIRRRQSLADLEIHAGQITVHATVGLAVLPKKEA